MILVYAIRFAVCLVCAIWVRKSLSWLWGRTRRPTEVVSKSPPPMASDEPTPLFLRENSKVPCSHFNISVSPTPGLVILSSCLARYELPVESWDALSILGIQDLHELLAYPHVSQSWQRYSQLSKGLGLTRHWHWPGTLARSPGSSELTEMLLKELPASVRAAQGECSTSSREI